MLYTVNITSLVSHAGERIPVTMSLEVFLFLCILHILKGDHFFFYKHSLFLLKTQGLLFISFFPLDKGGLVVSKPLRGSPFQDTMFTAFEYSTL